MFKRACIQIIAVQIAMTMTACTQKETKQFISDFNQATSIDFNIPYIDSTKVLAGDNIQDRNAMEQQALNQILSQTQPKQASGDYLMTNITLMGALCNPQNNLGYYINPQVTQAQSTLTRENTETIENSIQTYINGQFVGKNLGDTVEQKQLSQKYIIANLVYKILPSKDYQGMAINPNTTTLTRAQAILAMMNTLYGTQVIPEDYPEKVDATWLEESIKRAVDLGVLTEDQVPYNILKQNKQSIAWADQWVYLKASENESGATLLQREITYGELLYLVKNLLVRDGILADQTQQTQEQAQQTQEQAYQNKKDTNGYVVKSLQEIALKASESNKMQNGAIPNKQLALLRQLFIQSASKTVPVELYETYVYMVDNGLAQQDKAIYDTVTIDDLYKVVINIAKYVNAKGINWVDYKWVDPNPAPAPEPEPEPEYIDFDSLVAMYLIDNGIATEQKLGLEVYPEKQEKVTQETHIELSITGVNLTEEQYNSLYEYLESQGVTSENIGDFCKNPFAVRYKAWLESKNT